MTDTAPSLGHNRPPEPTPLERASDLVANANRWTTERPTITDEEQAGAAQDFVGQLRDVRADLEVALKAERKPHDDAIGAIRIKYRDPLELIGIALLKMNGLLAPWLEAKDARLRRDAEERQRQADAAKQAAERATTAALQDGSVEAELEARRRIEEANKLEVAAAKPVGRAQVKGDYSDRAMSLREYWSAQVTDETLALRSYAKHETVRRAALTQALREANKLARELKDESKAPPGFKFACNRVPLSPRGLT